MSGRPDGPTRAIALSRQASTIMSRAAAIDYKRRVVETEALIQKLTLADS
jgi:hypothetical protein